MIKDRQVKFMIILTYFRYKVGLSVGASHFSSSNKKTK